MSVLDATRPPVGVVHGHTADTRHTDPETSHAARDSISVEALAESQQEVLAILNVYGPQADHDIATLHELRYGQSQTPFRLSGQRLRTARHELVDLGLVEQSEGEARTESGRRANVWAVTS